MGKIIIKKDHEKRVFKMESDEKSNIFASRKSIAKAVQALNFLHIQNFVMQAQKEVMY